MNAQKGSFSGTYRRTHLCVPHWRGSKKGFIKKPTGHRFTVLYHIQQTITVTFNSSRIDVG